MRVVKKVDPIKLDYMDEKTEFYIFDLIEDGKTLSIHWDENLNLHMELKFSDESSFFITKQDDAIYAIFDLVYKNIVNGRPCGEYTFDKDQKISSNYNKVVDRKKNIIWESEDTANNKLIMSKLNDEYELQFIGDVEKNSIDIVFNGYNSKFYPYNSAFIMLYQKLQSVESLCYKENSNYKSYQYRKRIS